MGTVAACIDHHPVFTPYEYEYFDLQTTGACASIIAKVTRDRMMRDYDKIFPEYGFAGNKGYGSAEHMEALRKYGPAPIHRRSFIRNIV